MKTLLLTVSVEELYEYVGEVDLEVELTDDHYNMLENLANEYIAKEDELTEDVFQERLPEIYTAIDQWVDNHMPKEIDMDDDQTIDDFSWSICYPDNLCDFFE